MKVLITGGHVTPALAVIENLKDQDVVFVGRRYALDKDREDSFEYKEVGAKGIRFINLRAGRTTRLLSLRSLWNFLRIPAGFFSAWSILKSEKPDVVLSFGGYIAVPVTFVAYLMGKPVITHEQTIHPGLGNRFIGLYAKKVFVAFEEAKHFFPKRALVVGNPVRSEVFTVTGSIPHFDKTKPVLFVMGGALGAHSINGHIFRLLPRLLKNYTVIHQTGSSSEYKDNLKSKEIQDKNYFAFSHIPSGLIGFVYKNADLIISRAGANTIFEILAVAKPALLIPLPWSASDEQEKHALFLKKAKVAEVFDQSRTSEELLDLIAEMVSSLEKYAKNFDTIDLPYERKKTTQQIAEAVSEAAETSHSP